MRLPEKLTLLKDVLQYYDISNKKLTLDLIAEIERLQVENERLTKLVKLAGASNWDTGEE